MSTFITIVLLGVLIAYIVARLRDHAPTTSKLLATTEDEGEPVYPEAQADIASPFWYASHNSGRAAEARIRVNYTDRGGRKTQREIDVKRFGWDGKEGGLWAYCHARRDNRSFLISRISEAVDRDTGEVIENLGPWLESRWDTTDEGIESKMHSQLGDALSALFYLARCDGTMRQQEAQAIIDFVEESGFPRPIAERVPNEIRKWAVPSQRSYAIMLGKIAKDSPEGRRQAIYKAALSIQASKKKITELEAIGLAKMKAKFNID